MVQFYPWFKFSFSLLCALVMYDNEFKTKENKIEIKERIKPQHIHLSKWQLLSTSFPGCFGHWATAHLQGSYRVAVDVAVT